MEIIQCPTQVGLDMPSVEMNNHNCYKKIIFYNDADVLTSPSPKSESQKKSKDLDVSKILWRT